MTEVDTCKNIRCVLAREGPSLELLNRTMGVSCRSVQELSLLFAISQTLEKSIDLTDIAKPVLRRLQDLIGLERGTIAITNPDTGKFMLSESVGLPKGMRMSDYLQLIQPKLDETVEGGNPVIVQNFSQWLKEQGEAEDILSELTIAERTGLVCVPLKFENEAIGTLSIERPHDPQVGWEADLRILSMIASIIGQAARVRQQAAARIKMLREENDRLQKEIAQSFRPKNMIGNSSLMQSVYYHIEQVATSVTTVLIRGESGTGKELVAKALHEKGARKKQPFVKFNCAALPDSIIESELFGHEKGAFTGALAMRKGRFELANHGTIFLDEIGDISLATQIKLLRVLQEREFERVGSQVTQKVDVRIIAATSRDLEAMMEEGTFREDLYYRLNVFPIYMPPLRERTCDVLMLADHFIDKYTARAGGKPVRISSAAIDLLMSYHWPGNVRELENCVERAVLLSKGQSIKAHHLPPTLQKKNARERQQDPTTLEDAVQAVERELIVDTLKDTGSNMAEAARRLGLTERKMGLRVKKYDIDLKRYAKSD